MICVYLQDWSISKRYCSFLSVMTKRHVWHCKLPPLVSCFAVSQEDTCSFLGKLYTTEFRVEELLYTLKVLYRDTVAEDWKTIVKHRLNQSFNIIRTSETLLLYAQNLHKYGLSRNGKWWDLGTTLRSPAQPLENNLSISRGWAPTTCRYPALCVSMAESSRWALHYSCSFCYRLFVVANVQYWLVRI